MFSSVFLTVKDYFLVFIDFDDKSDIIPISLPPNAVCLLLLADFKMFVDFPGSPGVKTLHFHWMGCVFDPWSGN